MGIIKGLDECLECKGELAYGQVGLCDKCTANTNAGIECVECRRLRRALMDIAQGRGRFSMDQLTHASNTIEDMKQLAVDALAPTDERASDAL